MSMDPGQREAMRYYPDAAAKIISDAAFAEGAAAERARTVALLEAEARRFQGEGYAVGVLWDAIDAVRSASLSPSVGENRA